MDNAEWHALPQDISGGYLPSRNELQYPAAKFQPPFFDAEAGDAANYGAIGATMAHEIVHAFDDVGRQYDAGGNLRDWWSQEDSTRFRALAEVLEQFGEEVPTSANGAAGVRLARGTADLAEIVRVIDGRGLRVAKLNLHAPTLDDVFLAKTGRSLEGSGGSIKGGRDGS